MVRQYRKQWLKWHANYERKARIIFQRTFREIASSIPFENMTANTYQAYVVTHVSTEKITQAYKKVYLEVGLLHGKRVGKQINKQINKKDFTLDTFISKFERDILHWLITNGGKRIVLVRDTYIEFINELIARGLNDNKTIREISKDLHKLIKSRRFYRWQSLRIARTETTTAANYAATVSSSVSGVLMNKVWISAQDNRTRRPPESIYDHYDMNLQKVKLEDDFTVSGEAMEYPGDPNASAGNVINCRCTVAQVVRRDVRGNIMML